MALRNKLAGDFDIEVEFRDFAGPYQDHVQAFFQVYQDADNQLHIKRMRFGTGDARQTVAKVAGVFPIQSGTVIPSIDSGTLRIVRAGAQITTFFNGLQDFSISAFSGAVIVQLTLVGPAGSSVTFDNFQVHSGTLLDPSLMCPDDNHPPVITCHGPVILWSPDHELIDASSAFSVDDPDGDPVDISIRVFSDETEIPDTGDGTGRHAPDFKTALDSGAAGLFLRSERRGGEDGRFYLGLITADDGMGGVTEQVCILAVCPHDQTDPASLDAVLSQAAAAAGAFDFPTGLSEHGLSAPLGPHQ